MANNVFKKSNLQSGEMAYKYYARVENPSSVFPGFEILPLADPITSFSKNPLAFLMDMDGTTTTTETLCLYALEDAIRKAIGRQSWTGLVPDIDYPNIIGNSTTKHVEYLVEKYQPLFNMNTLFKHYLESARWTIEECRDKNRRIQAEKNLVFNGLGNGPNMPNSIPETLKTFEGKVRACSDIYYHTYHLILNAIEAGDDTYIEKLPGFDSSERLIKPMPAVAATLAILKGDLGREAGNMALVNPSEDIGTESAKAAKETLAGLGDYFAKHPVKVALVTSSIKFEADIVMDQVFKVINDEIKNWPVSQTCRHKLQHRFSATANCYDAFITANDATEMRLKPHRDLYSTALQMLQISPDNFDAVAGFEDSESGSIALRAAGVGLTVALPFLESANHNFDAASMVIKGGLPDVLINHKLFMSNIL